MSWIKNRIDAEFKKHKKSDWSGFAEAKIVSTILDWCYKNNTIPMGDLHRIECVCGHSLLEHKNCNLNKEIGEVCNHIFCRCQDYERIKFKSQLKLANRWGLG